MVKEIDFNKNFMYTKFTCNFSILFRISTLLYTPKTEFGGVIFSTDQLKNPRYWVHYINLKSTDQSNKK